MKEMKYLEATEFDNIKEIIYNYGLIFYKG